MVGSCLRRFRSRLLSSRWSGLLFASIVLFTLFFFVGRLNDTESTIAITTSGSGSTTTTHTKRQNTNHASTETHNAATTTTPTTLYNKGQTIKPTSGNVQQTYPPPFPGSRRVAAVIPISVKDIPHHIHSISHEWFHEMSEKVLFFYLIGRDAEAEGLSLIPPELVGQIHLLAVDSLDREYPPIKKELTYIPRLVELYGEFDAVIKFDSDTYVDPVRLNLYLDFMLLQTSKDGKPVFAGRPIHHCQCHPNGPTLIGKHCTTPLGVTYCSGAFYIVNWPAARAYVNNLDQCFHPPPSWLNTSNCLTSDTRFGACHNVNNIACTAASMFDEPDSKFASPRRLGWGRPINEKGKREAPVTQLCQVQGIHGGVVDRRHGEVYTFNHEDWEKCMAYHPLKTKEDMRYARFVVSAINDPFNPWVRSSVRVATEEFAPHIDSAMNFPPGGGSSASLEGGLTGLDDSNAAADGDDGDDASERCRLSIGVFSSCSASLHRDAIRATWSRVADALGTVRIRFIVSEDSCGGTRGTTSSSSSSEELKDGLRQEKTIHQDVYITTSKEEKKQEEESEIWRQTNEWLRYSTNLPRKCELHVLLDDYSYVRLMTLMNWLLRQWGTSSLPERCMFGWFPELSSTLLPISEQGGLIGMTTDVVREVLTLSSKEGGVRKVLGGQAQLPRTFNDLSHTFHRFADVINGVPTVVGKSLGECPSEQRVRLVTGEEFCPTKCVLRSIVDKPQWSLGWNMYAAFQKDLDGTFCTSSNRTTGLTTKMVQDLEETYFAYGNSKDSTHHVWSLQSASSSSSASPSKASKNGFEPFPRFEPYMAETSFAVPEGPNDPSYDYAVALELIGAKENSIPPWDVTPLGRAAWEERSPWGVMTRSLKQIYGGLDVIQNLADANVLASNAVREAVLNYVRSAPPEKQRCNAKAKVVDVWTASSMTRPNDLLFLLECPRGGTSFSYVLLHVPFQPKLPTSYQMLSVPTSPLAIVVPFSCQVDELSEFLDSITSVTKTQPGPIRIIIGWLDCAVPETSKIRMKEEATASTATTTTTDVTNVQWIERKYPRVSIVRKSVPYSRSVALNTAFTSLKEEEVAVILDIDIRIQSDYLRHVRAFTIPGKSAFFPIQFSRYNPSLVPPSAQGTFHLNSQTGLWRRELYSMSAIAVADLRRLKVGFETNVEYDTDGEERFYQACVQSDLSLFRSYEPSLIQLWHFKDCIPFQNNDAKFQRCQRLKILLEGTVKQIAEAHWKEYQDDTDKTSSKK